MADDLQSRKNALDLEIAQARVTALQSVIDAAKAAKFDVGAEKVKSAASGLLADDPALANINNLSSTLGLFNVVVEGALGEANRAVETLQARMGATPEASA